MMVCLDDSLTSSQVPHNQSKQIKGLFSYCKLNICNYLGTPLEYFLLQPIKKVYLMLSVLVLS